MHPGQLVGIGNLTILHTMLGSKRVLMLAEKFYLLKKWNWYKYHINRMLQNADLMLVILMVQRD
jgi:muramoyltetrapeptide carboxypeptidase